MVEKIIERMADSSYKGANGMALLRLDMEELAEHLVTVADTIENLEIKLEEANEKKEKIYLEKAVNCKQYKVGFYYEERGSTYVKADSADEAEEMVYKELEANGLEDIEYETSDRDYGTDILENN